MEEGGEGKTCADALSAADDEDVFSLETLDVVFGSAAFDVAVLGEDAVCKHFGRRSRNR